MLNKRVIEKWEGSHVKLESTGTNKTIWIRAFNINSLGWCQLNMTDLTDLIEELKEAKEALGS